MESWFDLDILLTKGINVLGIEDQALLCPKKACFNVNDLSFMEEAAYLLQQNLVKDLDILEEEEEEEEKQLICYKRIWLKITRTRCIVCLECQQRYCRMSLPSLDL